MVKFANQVGGNHGRKACEPGNSHKGVGCGQHEPEGKVEEPVADMALLAGDLAGMRFFERLLPWSLVVVIATGVWGVGSPPVTVTYSGW